MAQNVQYVINGRSSLAFARTSLITVDDLRRSSGGMIPHDLTAFINGRAVLDNYQLQDHDVVVFLAAVAIVNPRDLDYRATQANDLTVAALLKRVEELEQQVAKLDTVELRSELNDS